VFVPPIDPVVVDPPIAFLDYGGLFLCVFVVFSFVLAGLFNSRCLLWGSGRVNVSSTKCFFGWFFHLLSLILEAISTLLRRLLHDTHPPNRVPCRLPLLPPQVPVVLVVGVRRVGPTRLGAFCSLVHVRAMLRLF
jgi:hypothetical protein